METLREILDPDFILRNSVYVSLLVGFACPLVGMYLVLRRLIFLGVALPQVSSCGIACAFALHTWGIIPHLEHSESFLAFSGSTILTLVVILVLSLLERRSGGVIEGRIGTVYALSGAWSILLLLKNPYGEHGLLDRLKGQIIAVSDSDLGLTAGTYVFVLMVIWIFNKEFLLVSFDREMAITLRKNVVVWDALLFLLIGLTISMSVLTVGPLVTFGFLIIPPLTAHLISRSMRQLAILGSIIGGVTAFVGFAMSLQWDLPAGPTDVVLLGLIYGLVFVGKKVTTLVRRPRNGTVQASQPSS
jgi:ABC-type Mn2+/Zn2+ transport system permease subunit